MANKHRERLSALIILRRCSPTLLPMATLLGAGKERLQRLPSVSMGLYPGTAAVEKMEAPENIHAEQGCG